MALGQRIRLSGADAGSLAFLAAGVAVRLAYAFPAYRPPNDADCSLTGLCALLILDGHLPVFYGGVRLGSIESFGHALSFLLLGISRSSHALIPLLSGVLLVLASWLLFREVLGERRAPLALVGIALPSASFLYWTTLPLGYVETLLFGVVTLWLAARLARRGGGRLDALGLGLAAGLGWWSSLQSLMFLLPALGWLALARGSLFRSRLALLAALGFAAGAFPWIFTNVKHPFRSFRENWAARPAGSGGAVVSNARYLATYQVPDLVFAREPATRVEPQPRVRRVLGPLVAATLGVAGLLAAVRLAATIVSLRRIAPPPPLLFALLALASAGLFIFSEAGEVRGPTVRYSLPLAYSIAAAVALLVSTLARKSRVAAALPVLLLVSYNVLGYHLPGTATRQKWREDARADERLVAFLNARSLALVCGDYWDVFFLNLHSGRRIRGIPNNAFYDRSPYLGPLPLEPVPWAFASRSRNELVAWMARLGVPGEIVEVGPEWSVFLPAVNPPPGMTPELFLRRARIAVRHEVRGSVWGEP